METQARIIKQRENDIHGYDKRLNQVYKRLEKDLSLENFELIKKYDQMFVRQSFAKAYRCRNLNALLMLTRILDKNWSDVTKDDIDNLVYNIVQTYSDHKGKETNSTADAKKHLKMFFRWMKLGSNDLKTVTTALAGTLDASEVLFPQFDTSNNPAAQGVKRVECYKSGIRGIIEGTGSIPVNKYVKASGSKAGCVELWVKGTDDPALILGIYRGHDSEVTGINNLCTNSADGETNLVVDFK